MPRTKRLTIRHGEGPSRGRRQDLPPQPPEDNQMQRIRMRGVVQEEHLDLDELRNTNIPARVIEQGWHRLVAPKPQANMTLVQEFYYAIKPGLYRTEGVMVRGVEVQFNPSVLNLYFGLPDFPNYHRGFPILDTYDWDELPEYLADQLRQFPNGNWVPGTRVNHSELSLELAVWNVFVSHIISPVDTHQILRNDHPKVLLALLHGDRFDVGHVMCRALDRNLRTARFMVLPCTITDICRQAGVNVGLPGDRLLPEARSVGARVWNRLARPRHYPTLDSLRPAYDEDEPARGEGEEGSEEDNEREGEGGEGGAGGNGGADGDVGALAREVRETCIQLLGGITRIAHSLRRLTRKVERIDSNTKRGGPGADAD